MLEGLEREVKAVKKAREALGDKAPSINRGWTSRDGDSRPGGVLGKRRRGSHGGGGGGSSSDEDVPEDIKSIPMPRDTPPPIPKAVLDEWYGKRRARRNAEMGNSNRYGGPSRGGDNRGDGDDTRQQQQQRQAAAPVVEAKTVYEAAPVKRDLQQEAVSAFVPSAVRTKLNKGAGQGGLMEPEEADRLEEEGYMKRAGDRDGSGEAAAATAAAAAAAGSRKVTVEDVEDEDE